MYRSVHLSLLYRLVYNCQQLVLKKLFRWVYQPRLIGEIIMVAGRQRSFCKTQALENAMKIFWQKGYAGASLADLTAAMGINKPSMYSAFGNKEQLFIDAVEYYIEQHATPLTNSLHVDGSLKDRLHAYVSNVIKGQCGGDDVKVCSGDAPKGCFISTSITESESADFPERAKESVIKLRDFSEHYLTDFLTEEQQAGHLDKSADPAGIAQYLVTLMHGTAAMARGGKSQQELLQTIDTALNIFDSQLN